MELTAIGMFGKGRGWGIALPSHLSRLRWVALARSQKSWMGTSPLQEYSSLTISFDHDIIDGAPAARFTQRLKELIESGYGLFDVARLRRQEEADYSFVR